MNAARNLAVDVGNSSVKCGVFEGRVLVKSVTFQVGCVADIVSWGECMGVSRAIVSTVRGGGKTFCDSMGKRFSTLLLTSQLRVPFESRYQTPETFGSDRLSVMAAVSSEYAGQDVVVVDAGTALTCDYMSRYGVYEGGSISPGISMRFRSLHEQTWSLPLVGVESYSGKVGRSTLECIAAGVVGGILSEIEGFLQKIATFASDFRLVVTGGDAELLALRLERPCEVRRELVLEGLNAILQYNAE